MHPVSILTFGIFLAGYITARWDLITQLYELAIFAWDHGVVTRAAKGFAILSLFFGLFLIPIERLASREAELNPRPPDAGISAREQLRRRGSHGLMRVFWPSDAPRDDIPGVLVGWRNSELDVLVVGVLQGVDAQNVEHALRVRSLFRGSPHPIENIIERCGGYPIQVLGTLNLPNAPHVFDPKMLSLHTVPRSKAPKIDCEAEIAVTIQLIMFDRPDPWRMQYLSLKPISLALGDKRGAFGSVPPFDRIDREEEMERTRKAALVEKLKLHTVVTHPRTQKELALGTIICQINCSAEVNALMQSNIGMVGIRQKRSMSVSERVVESATNFWDFLLLWSKKAFRRHVLPTLTQILVIYIMAHRAIAEAMLLVLAWRPLPEKAALKDVSATAQQVDIRLQQFCYWPAQYLTLHRRRTDWESITNSHPEYIRFFNSLWLVANDVIIGIALGSYIIENANYVAYLMNDTINTYSIHGLQSMIDWLTKNPAGLKLNNDLAKFLGDLFLWVIEYWDGCMQQLRPALPHIIRFIGVSSFAGASMPIAMFSDLISILTVHIYSFYIASARIYNWQLTIIISLFHLFRGKKRNVLRNRIDRCDYDLDQLLLGTILFTLLFFLLPTVAVFYTTFAGARMAIIALKAGLDTWLACLNHFPLFALMLRLKDSRRLPGGIRFELGDGGSGLLSSLTTTTTMTSNSDSTTSPPENRPATSYIKLKSVPLPLPQTFAQYAQLGARIRKHYLSGRVFLCLVSGQFVPPIHRKNLYSLQYSMLPIRRVGIRELWGLLTDEGRNAGHVSRRVAEGLGVHLSPAAHGNGNAGANGFVGGGGGSWGKKGGGKMMR